MTSQAVECECTDEYGPCEQHCEVLAQREGASCRTADELALVFISDARGLYPDDEDPLVGWGREVVATVEQNMREHQSNWITDDPDLGDQLQSVVNQVENYIAPEYQTCWDDGYRIVKITGGPFYEED